MPEICMNILSTKPLTSETINVYASPILHDARRVILSDQKVLEAFVVAFGRYDRCW